MKFMYYETHFIIYYSIVICRNVFFSGICPGVSCYTT